ncbi:MAG: hypothetical protein A2381_16160 [Bdellovibrionales bacterium RIFOXYB1_FULL_37_110]|nr:MAG: hypothetical protein A2417_08010 [Bdellovibrionales bacterium RIFOXYC1_FULL_37_79]OFZ57147.1 MAG: hypothetical protein A2381_16160 [Bdellovibrionales bacterium RIFOXYB1_FULL_37_110]OFZ65369.1 MAG: hypothetical protein A2577_03710 [Bdellovibrionales bacterium RIFOXYD1_FULL_36_51]
MSSIKIYHYLNYKDFINNFIKDCPKGGRGQLLKISSYLAVHSTLISQVLRGHKDFTLEQAYKLSEYFGFNEIETDYFITLVQYEKAGTVNLKTYFEKQLRKIRDDFQNVSSRVVTKTELDNEDKAVYYSDWTYMAVWLLTSIPEFNNINKIAAQLELPAKRITRIMEFLIKVGLCAADENGDIHMGISKTHLESNSPLVNKHHVNWRLKAIENYNKMTSAELAFTVPITISKKDFRKIKNDILEFIEKASETVSSSPAEELACLNIDLFTIK